MSGYDWHLLIAYLLTVASVWVTAGVMDDLWKNRKHRKRNP